MITTNNKKIWKKVWSLKDHGKSYEKIKSKKSNKSYTWLHDSFGENWRMTEIQSNLEDALDKSIMAIKLSSNDLEQKANVLDTKAEILWLLNRYDEAISTINIAIEINPESDYFKGQRTKFKNSQNQE